MSKSKLSEACYDHDLEEVQDLLAAGTPADGSKEKRWRGDARGCIDNAPYHFPLGEACRSETGPVHRQLQIIDALLQAGADPNERDYCAKTALLHAAGRDRLPVLQRLLDAGADPNVVGGDGNAVATAVRLNTPDEPGGSKPYCLRMLLRKGVDPRGGFPGPDDLLDLVEDPCEDLASRSRDDKLRAQAILELMEVVGEASPDWEALQAWLERARAARLKGDAKARKLLERLEALRGAAQTKGFQATFKKLLGRTSANRYGEFQALTRVVLSAPEVVGWSEWPSLVRSLLSLTPSYGDLTEDAYGERYSLDRMDEDEGGVLDGLADEHRSTVEHCLQACLAPEAADREDFPELVEEIARTKAEKLGARPYGDQQAALLVRELTRRAHPAASRLEAVLRDAFPEAPYDVA